MGNSRVCPVERAGSLESGCRRWVHDPSKILAPYIKEGMTVLDFGCGPGFFTVAMAELVGRTGKVVAVDLQEGMLNRLRAKISNTELEKRIKLHKAKSNRIGITEEIDFALAFYVIHELDNQEEFFKELKSILKPNGRILISEPPLHVTKSAFAETKEKATRIGLKEEKGPRIFLNKTVIFLKQA
jgi:ubiquinone/menaquinone biosynthesis C-methylase UbiE